jgi:YgiT-type zinc finger domain-containing protein
MSSEAHDCCRCSGKMREGRHDFMAKVGNEIVVIKDVPALICDTCGEVEYTLQISREIDVIMKEFFAGRLLAKPQAAGEIVFKPQRADSIGNNSKFNWCISVRSESQLAVDEPFTEEELADLDEGDESECSDPLWQEYREHRRDDISLREYCRRRGIDL